MIIQNNKTISALYKGTKEIVKRYKGTQVIYEAWKELIKSGVPPITLLKCKPANFSAGLPSPYQQVEYLESTGTQFIDMKYTYKVNDILDINFMKTNDTNTIQGIFGNGNTQPYVGVSLYVNNANLLTTTIGGILGENFARYSTPIENNVKYNVKIKGGTVYLNDEEIITVPNILFDGTQEDFSLFRRWGTNTMIGRIYKFSISRNNKKIFELIPCYRKSDNVLGMYDLVNDVFYTNSGTGEFLKGKDVATYLVDYKIYGDSKQQNKNLWVNGDIVGTGQATIRNCVFQPGTYTISCNVSSNDTRADTCQIVATDGNNELLLNIQMERTENSKKTFTLYKPTATFIFRSSSGYVAESTAEYSFTNIQIEEGSTATEYVSPIPTPDNPIEVESVGEKTKNLFNNDINSIKQITYYGTSGTEYKRYGYELYLPVGTYTINAISKVPSTNTTLYYMYGNVVDENNNVVGKSVNCVVNSIVYPTTFTIEEGEKLLIYDGITGSLTQAKQLFSLFDVQLEEGSTTTEYEPYGYKIPVKVSGKNLFNASVLNYYDESIKGLRIKSSGRIYRPTNLLSNISYLEPNKTYVLNAQHSHPDNGGAYIYLNGSGRVWKFGQSLEITQADLGSTINFYKCASENDELVSQEVTITNIQIEEGSTVTSYEPYHEPITTNIYLKEPLRKIGDYADYIDFEKRKVFRNIKTKIFDGTETFYVISNASYEQYTYYILSIKNNVVNDTCLSSYFVLQTNFSYMIKGDNKFRIYYSPTNSQSRIGFRVVENGEIIADPATLKAKFAEAYKSGKPCTFYYAVPKDYETSEDITLPNIPLNKGTNIIEVDTSILPSNMEVKYIGKE